MKVIDSHHHFWKYSAAEYGWIDDSMACLRKDFLPKDLKAALSASHVHSAVSVQARQTVDETRWLLDHAEGHSYIAGVVGWAPLADPKVGDLLDEWKNRTKLRGLRHVVQGESDPEFLSRPDFNRGIEELTRRHLAYDLLIRESQLEAAAHFVDRHPDQRFILDHAAKPKIKDREIEPWKRNISELAKRDNVAVKLSGLVTEADFANWNEAELRPYMDAVLEAFGTDRILFGSDWPVCLAASTYPRWKKAVETFTEAMSDFEKEKIFGRNAIGWYGLKFFPKIL